MAACLSTPMRRGAVMPEKIEPAEVGANALDGDLLDAVKAGDAQRTRELLGQGANPNATFSEEGYSNQTPLMYAAERGHTAVIRVLLAAGARVKAKDRFIAPGEGGGETALDYAVRGRHAEAARVLVEAGANIDAMGGGYTPLMKAVQAGDAA